MKIRLVLAVVCMLASCGKKQDIFVIHSTPNEPDISLDSLLEEGVWDDATTVRTLHAPWDSLVDETLIRAIATPSNILIRFDVKDSDILYRSDFTEDNIELLEDRVEIFFSPRKEMDIYYCAELSPIGDVLDYSSRYYREMDYKWNFKGLRAFSRICEDGFSIVACFDREEVEALIERAEVFYMGLFRADFHRDRAENWYSLVSTTDLQPDFHIPSVLFKTTIDLSSKRY